MTKIKKLIPVAAVTLSLFPQMLLAGAFTFSGSPATGAPGGATTTLVIQFAGDGTTVDAGVDYTIPSGFTAATPTASNGATCTLQSGNTVIQVISPAGGSTALPAGPTAYCSVVFNVNSGTAAGTYDLTQVSGSVLCGDPIGTPVSPCTAPSGTGAIVVAAGGGNTPPTITYSPAQDSDGTSDGTVEVAFPAGAAGAASANITPSIVGGSGSGTGSAALSGCTASSGFSITSGGTQTFPVGGTPANIVLGCTRGGSASTGTLTCTETPSPSGSPRTLLWDLSCPMATGGGTTPPTVTYNPTAGTAVTMTSGTTGATSTGSVAVTINTDGSGTGAGATTNVNACSVTGATGFTVSTTPGGGVTAIGNAGASGTANVSCTIGASAVTGGTLSCTEDAGGTTATRSWPVTCPAASGGGATNPTATYSPAPSTTVSLTGGTGSITPTTSGASGGGSTTFSCTAPSGFSITGGGSQTWTTNGAQTALGLSCTQPTAGSPATTGTLSCTVTPSGGAPSSVTWNLSCPAAGGGGSVATPVPALGALGKTIMVLMMLGLGLAVFQVSRRSA